MATVTPTERARPQTSRRARRGTEAGISTASSTRALAEGRLPAMIVIGIAADDGLRSRDLSPVPWSGSTEGRGVQYGDFVAWAVVPATDHRFRTIAATGSGPDRPVTLVQTQGGRHAIASWADRAVPALERLFGPTRSGCPWALGG